MKTNQIMLRPMGDFNIEQRKKTCSLRYNQRAANSQ